MIDRERVLAKLDDLHGYLRELRSVAPSSFADYLRVEKRRACERLVQVSIEAVSQRLGDFETFRSEIQNFLRRR